MATKQIKCPDGHIVAIEETQNTIGAGRVSVTTTKSGETLRVCEECDRPFVYSYDTGAVRWH